MTDGPDNAGDFERLRALVATLERSAGSATLDGSDADDVRALLATYAGLVGGLRSELAPTVARVDAAAAAVDEVLRYLATERVRASETP